MSDWTQGYVVDIEYTYGYYGELNPLRLAMAFLYAGLVPPRIATACELGYGQGVTVNIHAAASDVRWYGTDFHPAHAAFAQALAEESRSGAQLFDQSFAEFCTRSDLPDFDYVALHGIYSWISGENQKVIVDFLRRKLKVGGVLYISYNTTPGFAPIGPVQQLMAKHAELMAPPSQSSLAKADAAIEFVERVLALNPIYAAANPTVPDRVRTIKGQNRHYVAHEYLNEHWRPLAVAELAEHLAPAKLGFACSATYLDHIDAVNLTPEQHRFVADIADPVFRQTVRDFMINQQFRRDYWVKGGRRLAPFEQVTAIRQQQVVLVANRGEVIFNVTGALGQREMAAGIYGPILDVLADDKVHAIGDIERALSGHNMRLATLYEALMVLVGKGDVVPAQDEEIQSRLRAQTDRLNLTTLERARGGGELGFLASTVTGGGAIAAPRFHQLFLLALRQGRNTPDELGRFVWDIIAAQGQRVAKDNKPLESEAENLAELTGQAREFLDKRMPIIRRLQIG